MYIKQIRNFSMFSFIDKLSLLISTKPSFIQSIRKTSSGDSGRLERPTHKVDNLEKRFLVWTGKYKSIDEVPTFVNQHVVEKARNRMRIRIANYMIVATIIGCIAMVYSGKQAVKRGESITQENIEWHRQLREEAKAASNAKQ